MLNIFQSNKAKMFEDEIYCLLNYGQNKRALDKINKCYEQSYVTPSIMALESVARARLGYHERAVALCNELFDIGTTDYNIFHLLLEAFRALGSYSSIEKLCIIALKHNNTEENQKILLNTYVRMLKFDLAQSIALKIFIKTRNQSIGILYCLFAILKEDSKPESIQVALKFMNKLDFTEFKPEIRFYLELSLLLAIEDYDGIINYFKESNTIPSENDRFELLLYVHVKKGDYKSALDLIHNLSNKSLNISIYEIDLSLLTNAEYETTDLYLKLEYIKRKTLYHYLIKNNKMPKSHDDLWSINKSDLNKFIQLLNLELSKNIEKPILFKYAGNFLPFININQFIPEFNAFASLNANNDKAKAPKVAIKVEKATKNAYTNSLMAQINYEKIRISSGFFESSSLDKIEERIVYFTNYAMKTPTIEILLLLIELHLIKYYRNDHDLVIICQLLNTIELISDRINSTVLYNILIDLYGFMGCIERSKSFYIKMNYKESQLSTQGNRFLHYSLVSLKKNFSEKCTESFLHWFNNTRSFISNSLVTAVESNPYMIPHLCKLVRIHSCSGLYCYNLCIKLLNYMDSDIDKFIKSCKLYIDDLNSFINGNMHWYCRNTTACFAHFTMPTFEYSCLNAIPLIKLHLEGDANEAVEASEPHIFPMDTTYFDEPQLIFPHRFYRKFTQFHTLNEIMAKSKYFQRENVIHRHTNSALYKFNMENYQLLEMECLVFLHIVVLMYNVHEQISISDIATSLKKHIAKYISLVNSISKPNLSLSLNNSDVYALDPNQHPISDLSNELLAFIESNDSIYLSKIKIAIDKCIKLLEVQIEKDSKTLVNQVFVTTRLVCTIALIPERLLLVLKWLLRNRGKKSEAAELALAEIDEAMARLSHQIMNIADVTTSIIMSAKDMDENEQLVCRSNISILKRYKSV